jgi:hypothetical protein
VNALRIAVLLTALTLVGCSAAEQPIIDQFFTASRLRDHTALGSFSTVSFEPAALGTINSFTITNVTAEQRRPPLEAQRVVIDLSVADPRNRIDSKKYAAELVSKDVTIDAPLRLPSGQTVPKTLVVTLQRAELKGDKTITGRWIITDVKDGSGSLATPRS